ncbi:MAG: hypothetical protein H7345_12125, partial [Rubritepida sp.]|nr:hypothetical protein [Rubritepida sp.]
MGLRRGFDGRGQTIGLELAGGAEAAGGQAWAALRDGRALQIAADEPGLAVALACGAALRAWGPKAEPARLHILTPAAGEARRLWALAEPGIIGNRFARDLVVAPANRLTPRDFVGRLRALSGHVLKVGVRGRKRLPRDGFGALCAVGRAAASGPVLVTLRWPGAGRPGALVGKGVCLVARGTRLNG